MGSSLNLLSQILSGCPPITINYSHLPVSTFQNGNSTTRVPNVESTRIIPFQGIGGSQRVLPLAAGALSENATDTPKQDELSRTQRLTPFAPGEIEHPEVVDRFSIDSFGFRSRNDQSTAKFNQEKACPRYVARMEHENVYRRPEFFADGHNNTESSVISKEELLRPRKERPERLIAEEKRQREREAQSVVIDDSPLPIENHLNQSSSSEDELPDNVLHDSTILASGVTPKAKKPKKKDSKHRPFLKNDTRAEVVKFLHDFSHWAVHTRKQPAYRGFDMWLGKPKNRFDFARTALCEVDPEGVSGFIDQTTLSTWKMMDAIGNDTDAVSLEQSIWRLLVDKSQFSSTTAASSALKSIRLGNAKDPLECIENYLCNIIRSLKCSMAIPTISSDPTDRDHLHASTVADIILATLNPKQDIVTLNELHVRWDHKLKSDDSLLPRFFNEVKGIWITYMRSTAVAAPPANRRDMRHGPPRIRGPQSRRNDPPNAKTSVKCYNCGKPGHLSSECRRNKNNMTSRVQSGKPLKRRSIDSLRGQSDQSNRNFNNKSNNYIFQISVDNTKHATPEKYMNPLAALNTHSSQGRSTSSVETIRSLNQNLGIESKDNGSLCIRLLINNEPVIGEFDSAASCSVISQDLVRHCEMTTTDSCIEYISANNIRATSLGSALGILTFNVGSLANQIHIKHTLPVVPGTKILLIGRDLQEELGLLTDDGLVIRLDKEHRTILSAESVFDGRMKSACESINSVQSNSSTINLNIDLYGNTQTDISLFEEIIDNSGCTIELDDPNRRKELLSLLS
ncbi:hypothetical protein GEMRC1_011273 [Eukaryota sp. GEM-RC1]